MPVSTPPPSFVEIVKRQGEEAKAPKELKVQIPVELVTTSVEGEVAGFMSTNSSFLKWGEGAAAKNSMFSARITLNARPSGVVTRNLDYEKKVDHSGFISMLNAATTEYTNDYVVPSDATKPLFENKAGALLPVVHFDITDDRLMSRVILGDNEILKCPPINLLRSRLGTGHWYLRCYGIFDVYVSSASKTFLRFHCLEARFYSMMVKESVSDLSKFDKSYMS